MPRPSRSGATGLFLLALATSLSAQSGWTQFRGNARLTGIAAEAPPAALSLRWTYETGDVIESSPAIADGVVYVGAANGDLLAIDLASGKLRWKYATGSQIGESSPAVHAGAVFLGDLGGTIHAVSTADGRRLWTMKTSGEVKSSPTVVDDLVLVGSYDTHLYALDRTTGAVRWKLQTRGPVHATPGVHNGVIYIAGCDEHFRAIRVADGRVVFELPLGAYTGASTVVEGTRAFVGTFESEVLGIDLTARRLAWTYRDPDREFPYYSSAAVVNGRVILGGRDKAVHAIDAATGKSVWKFVTRARVDSSPAVAAGRVFIGSSDGKLYVLDAATGKKEWEFDAGDAITASPAVAGGRVVVGPRTAVCTVSGKIDRARGIPKYRRRRPDRRWQLLRRQLSSVFRVVGGGGRARRTTGPRTPGDPATPLGLYLHIPFCRKRCHFCYFRVYTDKNSQEVAHYLDILAREWELYVEQPAVRGRVLNFVYFGGGTPSFLSTQQLERLVKQLTARTSWKDAEEITFECEPGTLTEGKLRAIRRMGVTRLSLGVENFDDRILELNGRAHRSPEIGQAYRFARALRFPQINIDLIAGMLGETEENWRSCVQKTLDLDPDSVTIYQMELPFNTTISKNLLNGTRLFSEPVVNWSTKRRWVREAFEALERAGYHVGSAYTAVKDPVRTKFVYRDRLWQGADMAGLGVASFGHINGVHLQNKDTWETYSAAVEADQLPLARAYRPTREERMIRELVLQLKRGTVSPAYFQDKYQVNILERFSSQVASLAAERYLEAADEERLTLSRDGLMRVDTLLPRFFLPQHVGIRYT